MELIMKMLLHIIVTTKRRFVPIVLVDNKSGFNIFPFKVASYFGLGPEDFTPRE